MRSNKKLISEIETLDTMGGVIEAYQEIAALRMRRVKKSVLQNRDFLMGLNDIYAQVVTSYKSYRKLRKKRKVEDFLRKTNGKSVSILLSANTGLYGNVIRETYDKFIQETRDNNNDLIIVGRYGKKFYDNSGLGRDYRYFDFSDSGSDTENSKELLQHIIKYEKIYVYHGYFQDILSQVPQVTAVTGSNISDLSESKEKLTSVLYFYEPSIEDILAFFEKEILSTIFEQSIYESSLSKFASRMINLDYAMANIRGLMSKTDFLMRKSKHRLSNQDQQNLLSGISLWSQ